VPRTQCSEGVQCGTEDDGCGGQVLCGDTEGVCPGTTGDVCLEGLCVPGPPPCTPVKADACANRVCDEADDLCGGIIDCGDCSPGAECSSDGSTCVFPQQPCTPLARCTKQCGTEVSRAGSEAGEAGPTKLPADL